MNRLFVVSCLGLALAWSAAALDLRTDHFVLKLAEDGTAKSLLALPSQRELLREDASFVALQKKGKMHYSRLMKVAENVLTYSFWETDGEIDLVYETHRSFLGFKVTRNTVPDVEMIFFCVLYPTCNKYFGHTANLLSDDTDGICVRAGDTEVENFGYSKFVAARTHTYPGLVGYRAAMVAGAIGKIPDMLKEVAPWTTIPYTHLGGAWARESEENRGSYLFSSVTTDSVFSWIDLAMRGGFQTIHYDSWEKSLGHYEPNGHFPKGLPDMKWTADVIHKAGLRTGMHTLTSGISPHDSWIGSDENTNLTVAASYTLSKDVNPSDEVIYVNEPPIQKHDVVLTYSGYGNVIRIGTELIQYSEVLREKPYGFAKCKHGCFGSKVATHRAGVKADYLWCHYYEFYPIPTSTLMDKVADAIANVYNTCGMRGIYLDGFEGIPDWYGRGVAYKKIFTRLKEEPISENSCWDSVAWWGHSRVGAWDHPVWGAKPFHDRHIRESKKYGHYLLGSQMGWWAPRWASPVARGHFLDEMEYFASKNFGIDSVMSIQCVNANNTIPLNIEQQMTVLGWYEKFRLARYFDQATVSRVGTLGQDFRLRQDRDGEWRFTPVAMSKHRVSSASTGFEKWMVENQEKEQPLCCRVEALYATGAFNDPKSIALVSAEEFSKLKKDGSSEKITWSLQPSQNEAHGKTMTLTAENKSQKPGWIKSTIQFPGPAYRSVGDNRAIGLWINGDGSGVWLDVRIHNPREYMGTEATHLVKIDFRGWRYIELLTRERDVEEFERHKWDKAFGIYSSFRNDLDLKHISQVDFMLGDIPANGSAKVEIGEVRMTRAVPIDWTSCSLTVNGNEIRFPYPFHSGDYVELESDGTCSFWKEAGALVAKSKLAAVPNLRSGKNEIIFACQSEQANLSKRSEITVNTLGAPFGTKNPQANTSYLTREYDFPQAILNTSERLDVIVGKGMQVKIQNIRLTGELQKPVLVAAGHRLELPDLKAGQTLSFRDATSDTYYICAANGKELSRGTIRPEDRFVLDAGVHQLELHCLATKNGRISWYKTPVK